MIRVKIFAVLFLQLGLAAPGQTKDPCFIKHCSENQFGTSCYSYWDPCDDGDFCTVDNCISMVGCTHSPTDCNDWDPCTDESCGAEGCVNTPMVCEDDGDPTTMDFCSGGTCQSKPIEPITIWKVAAGTVTALDPSVIRTLAQTAYAIVIVSDTNPGKYVRTTRNSRALKNLKNGVSLSTRDASYDVRNDWEGPLGNDMMGVECEGTGDFVSKPYHACGNAHGLHLMPGAYLWDWSEQGEDSISIKVYSPVKIEKIWSCEINSNDQIQNVEDYPLETIKTLAKSATQITIMSRVDPNQYVRSSAGYPPLDSLIAGISLSIGTNGALSNPYNWEGPLKYNTRVTCGVSRPFNHTPYLACGNPEGIYLTTNYCTFNYSDPTPVGGIGVYLQIPL